MAQNVFFVKILVKLDVMLDPRIFIYWLILKTLSLVCVCACGLAHSSVFICVGVPVGHLKMADKFSRKKYFNNPAHTISKLDYGNILSKEAWKTDNFQKKWKLACLALILKRRKLWKSKAIDKVTPETNNCIYWKIFPYLFAGMWISVLKKKFIYFFLISGNLKRFSI